MNITLKSKEGRGRKLFKDIQVDINILINFFFKFFCTDDHP